MNSSDKREIYLDNNATTEPLPAVRNAMLEPLGPAFGNPSSAHSAGDRARCKVLTAREALARLIGANPEQIVFTSGATEANNMVLSSVTKAATAGPRIITTRAEHSSILGLCEHLSEMGTEIVYLPVDRGGHIDIRQLEKELTPQTSLVSIQWVNNETGIIQPVQVIGELCRTRGVPYHTDAAQAVGKLEVDLSDMPIDYLSLTGHKFHGPQGIGAVYSCNPKGLHQLLFGGPQEYGLRPGTENMPGIIGIGKAAELRFKGLAEVQAKLSSLRDELEELILKSIPDVEVNGDQANRACNTTNLLFHGTDGQALVARLDLAGVRCSQSSACTNHRPEPSYVLRAMGLSEEEAYSSVRFSLSELNTRDQVKHAVGQIAEICRDIRAFLRKTRDVPAATRS